MDQYYNYFSVDATIMVAKQMPSHCRTRFGQRHDVTEYHSNSITCS